MPGTLSIVATPIGNLEDVTYRAIRTLRECDVIAAEDTRRTSKLLARYDIRKPLVSLREHNEAREGSRLVERVLAGEHVAYVTDAGTPGIADPGSRLVRLARDRGAPVVAIPGPSAIATALSVSGAEGDQFTFLGFPPSSGGARKAWLESASTSPKTVVFFEAPHRIRRTVDELYKLAERPMLVMRELTKVHDELVVCSSSSDLPRLREAGEYTVVMPARPESNLGGESAEARPGIHDAIYHIFSSLTASGCSREAAYETLAVAIGMRSSQVKRIVKSRLFMG